MKNFKSKKVALVIAALLAVVNIFSILIDVKGTNQLTIVDGNFKVTVNGQAVKFNNQYGYPKLIKETERTLIPLRIISENMGYNVDWNSKNQTATIKGGDSTVEISIGETTALVDGKRVAIDVDGNGKPLDTKAMLLSVKGDVNPRTYVPLRFISETTGAKIAYKNVNNIHYIDITIGDGTPIPVPDIPDVPDVPEVPEKEGYVGNVKFNPEIDIMKDGRLTHEKTRDFLDEMTKNIKVTKEDGNYYLKWTEVPLPEGQKYGLGFSTFFNRTTTDLGYSLTNGNDSWILPGNKLPSGSFKIKLDKAKMSDIRFYQIDLAVFNPNKTGTGTRKYSAKYIIDYNPNTKSSTISPYDKTGGIMPDEPFSKNIIFGPGF